MKLQAWRTTILNPIDDPEVYITIASADPKIKVFPWVLPLERAEAIFGKDGVDKITEMPREVFLTLTLANRNE